MHPTESSYDGPEARITDLTPAQVPLADEIEGLSLLGSSGQVFYFLCFRVAPSWLESDWSKRSSLWEFPVRAVLVTFLSL